MTFEEWLEPQLDRARENADEGGRLAPAAYGTGWDRGYEAALRHVFASLPASIAHAPYPQGSEEANG